MNGYDAYKLYVALKNHFKGSYDFFKYGTKNKVNYNSYDKRKDKVFFDKLAKHTDLENYLLANFIKDSKLWVRDLAYSSDAEEAYQTWNKKQQALTYLFKQEIIKLEDDFNRNFVVTNNQHPILLIKYLASDVSLETLCILLDISNAKKYWDNELHYDPVWDNLRLKVEKYTPFIKYDKDKFKKICLDHFV